MGQGRGIGRPDERVRNSVCVDKAVGWNLHEVVILDNIIKMG